MVYDPRLQLDMTPDGQFRTAKRQPIATRIILWSVIIAGAAGALAFAAFALWIALALIPVVIVAISVAVLTLRFKAWQMRRATGTSRAPVTFSRFDRR